MRRYFILTTKKCRIYAAFGVSQTPINSVKERNFQLEFTYPDKSQRKNMRIIHRDMTQNELRDIRKSNSNLADITSKLANGEIRKEDLDEDTVNRLKDVLYN